MFLLFCALNACKSSGFKLPFPGAAVFFCSITPSAASQHRLEHVGAWSYQAERFGPELNFNHVPLTFPSSPGSLSRAQDQGSQKRRIIPHRSQAEHEGADVDAPASIIAYLAQADEEGYQNYYREPVILAASGSPCARRHS